MRFFARSEKPAYRWRFGGASRKRELTVADDAVRHRVRILVRAVRGLVVEELGGCEMGSHAAGVPGEALFEETGQTEVPDPDAPAHGEEVLGLDVAVFD